MEKKNIHNGYEYVDLGLPSGTLWATENFGNSSLYSFNNKEDLDSFASNHIGGAWKIPTKEQFKELIENTTSISVENFVNGISGRLFTSNVNGKGVFFPFYGYTYDGKCHDDNARGNYWTNSHFYDWRFGNCTNIFKINNDEVYLDYYYHAWGYSIRSVVKKSELFKDDAEEIAKRTKELSEDVITFCDKYSLTNENVVEIVKLLNKTEFMA